MQKFVKILLKFEKILILNEHFVDELRGRSCLGTSVPSRDVRHDEGHFRVAEVLVVDRECEGRGDVD